MKQRRSDGKFGRDPILPETAIQTARPRLRAPTPASFKKGHPGMGGRPKGRKNRTVATMERILQTPPGDMKNPLWDGVGKPPLDDLEALQWIKLHPLANLDSILAASDKRAKFFHRILRDDQVTHKMDIGEFERKISAAQEALAKLKNEEK